VRCRLNNNKTTEHNPQRSDFNVANVFWNTLWKRWSDADEDSHVRRITRCCFCESGTWLCKERNNNTWITTLRRSEIKYSNSIPTVHLGIPKQVVVTLTHFHGFNFQDVFPYPDFEDNILCNTVILYGGFVRDREGNVCYRSFPSSTHLIGKCNKVKGSIQYWNLKVWTRERKIWRNISQCWRLKLI
jgi:hypothetical protein